MTRAVMQFNSRTVSGDPVATAEVDIYIAGGTIASVYALANGGSALAQPLVSDANGFIRFYVDAGIYDITSTDMLTTNSTVHNNVEIGTSRESLIDNNQHSPAYSLLNPPPNSLVNPVDITSDAFMVGDIDGGTFFSVYSLTTGTVVTAAPIAASASTIIFFRRATDATLEFTPFTGVTIESSYTPAAYDKYSVVALVSVGLNTWSLVGDLER